MAKKIRSSDSSITSFLDVFEAIKRARIRKGHIRRPKLDIQPTDNGLANLGEHTKRQNKEKSKASKPPSAEKKPAALPSNPEKLIDATEKGHDILFTANTIFPFTLFPDTVTLDKEKLTFAKRYFFYVAKITSIPVRDILSVDANVGPFFGSVHTSSRYFITYPLAINFLWRKDAIKLQRLLQGYIIAHEQEIDCAHINKEQLITLLNDLGQGDTG